MRKLTKSEKRRLAKLHSTDDILASMRYVMSAPPWDSIGENGLERAAKRARAIEALKKVLESGVRPKTLAKMSIKRKKKNV